jgi:hypothetical protein
VSARARFVPGELEKKKARCSRYFVARALAVLASAGRRERAQRERGGKVREAAFFYVRFVVCLHVTRSNFLFAGALLQAMTFGEL